MVWQKYWAAGLSFMTCSLFGHYYLHRMKKHMGADFIKSILITKKGYSYCYFDEGLREQYGKFIADKVFREGFENYITDLKKQYHSFVDYIDSRRSKEIKKEDFEKFCEEFFTFTGLYVSQRNIVDFASEDKLNLVFDKIKELRKYTEESWVKSKEFEHELAEQIESKTNISKELALCMTFKEILIFLDKGKVPKKEILEKRNEISVHVFFPEREEILVGKKAEKMEDLLLLISNSSEIKGQCAYPGKIKGRARVIFEPEKVTLEENVIIVTGMTRPEFLPLMEKAIGFVTDAGGILCHAAIVSREMKKPCVIGTQNATLLIKDGDLIEVDAEKGIIRKID